MKKQNILFVCIHNSARSQMAEAFLNQLCGEFFVAQSAGLEPGKLNPVVVEAMREVGVDISKNQTKSVSQMLQSGPHFDCVITVCDETSAERCPLFPGAVQRLHWSFPDPSQLQGTAEEKLAGTRAVRDSVKQTIEDWCAEICSPAPAGV
jgi:arsenate reductase